MELLKDWNHGAALLGRKRLSRPVSRPGDFSSHSQTTNTLQRAFLSETIARASLARLVLNFLAQ